MPKRQVTLFFPQELIKEPVVFTMATTYNVMPNIRRAKVTEDSGEMTLELEGSEHDLGQAIAYLEERGIRVDPVTGDIVTG